MNISNGRDVEIGVGSLELFTVSVEISVGEIEGNGAAACTDAATTSSVSTTATTRGGGRGRVAGECGD